MSLFSRKQKLSPSADVAPARANQPAAEPGYAELSFAVPWSAIEAKLARAAEIVSAQRPLTGFRAGHVPVDVARQRYGDQALLAEAYDLAVPALYLEAVRARDLDSIGQPRLSFESEPAWGANVEATATVAVLPRVSLPDLAGVHVEPAVATVTAEQVDAVIESFRERYASEAAVARPAQTGDLVELDYVVSLAGVPLEGGSGTGHRAIVGRGHLLPEIEAAVAGMSVGEAKDITVSFPEAHGQKLVAGKSADCRVTLRQVFERQLPPLDDELAKRCSPFPTLAEMRERVEAQLKLEAEADARRRTEDAAVRAVAAAASIGDLPALLIDDEVSRMVHELQHSLEHQGAKFDSYLAHLGKTLADLRLDFVQPATERLRAILVLRAVSREQGLAPKPEEVEAEVERLAARAKDPEAARTAAVRSQVTAELTQRRALDWLVERVAKPAA